MSENTSRREVLRFGVIGGTATANGATNVSDLRLTDVTIDGVPQ
jgi:hypothetical protein